MVMSKNKIQSGRYVITVDSYKEVSDGKFYLKLSLVIGVFSLLIIYSLFVKFEFIGILFLIISLTLSIILFKKYRKLAMIYNESSTIYINYIIDTDKDIFIYPTENGQEQIKISNILKLDESQKIIRKNQQSYGTYYIELTASLEGYKVFEFSDKSHRDEVYSLLYGVIKYGTK